MTDLIRFWKQWPECLHSIDLLCGDLMPLLDDRYLKLEPEIAPLYMSRDIDEVRYFLSKLWGFNERFTGEAIGGDLSDYQWAVYSLCYLCEDENLIDNLLKVYVPLLKGEPINNELGNSFQRKICSTFMDDVGHVLWDLQEEERAGDHTLFDWHGTRNDLPLSAIEKYVDFAKLTPLSNPDFPPSYVLLHFTNLQVQYENESDYRSELMSFYNNRGYEFGAIF